jgi:hypothetical protein
LRYNCKILIENKTGKKLDVSINAKSDDVIHFEGSWSGAVTDKASFDGTFFVDQITEEQDDMRMHPCILADVYINGRHAELGLGIEPKFPVIVGLGRKKRVSQIGMSEEIYVNIKNSLPADATVSFDLPENSLLHFAQSDCKLRLIAGKDVSFPISAVHTGYGYENAPVKIDIKMENGDSIVVERPLHIINQGLTGCFGFESDEYHGAANGLWRLKLGKKNNVFNFDRLISSGFGEFYISKLGKPYDDEFNLAKPQDVRVTHDNNFIKFEADYISGKFIGAVLTEVCEFDSAGIFRRSHRVVNKGSAALELSLSTRFITNIGKNVVFPYDGGIHTVTDKMNYGFDTIDQSKIDENWVFDAGGGCCSGIYWPPQYKPDINWGDFLTFEFNIGELAPGHMFKTYPIFYMCDVFKNFS